MCELEATDGTMEAVLCTNYCNPLRCRARLSIMSLICRRVVVLSAPFVVPWFGQRERAPLSWLMHNGPHVPSSHIIVFLYACHM